MYIELCSDITDSLPKQLHTRPSRKSRSFRSFLSCATISRMLCLASLGSLLNMTSSAASTCDLLVLGAGWTFGFLSTQLAKDHPKLTYVATTRDGRNGTLKWAWDQEQDGEEQYKVLPRAKTVLVTFPLKGEGYSRRMVEGYEAVHGSVRWIQLGSTGIYDVS